MVQSITSATDTKSQMRIERKREGSQNTGRIWSGTITITTGERKREMEKEKEMTLTGKST